MGIVSLAVVAVTSVRLIPAPASFSVKLLIRLGNNFTLIVPIFVLSELFSIFTVSSFSAKLVASVAAHLKVYSCVACVLEVGSTVMSEPVGSTILLPPTEVTVILPVEEVPAPTTCAR